MTKNFATATIYPKDNRTSTNVFQGLKILAVDDQDVILSVITAFLDTYGIQVMTASNAKAGFEIIKQCSVNLLISDINMPGESGIWLIQKIRSLTLPEKRDIPAIALTGNVLNMACSKALQAGFQTYMEKPFDQKELIKEVAKLLSLPESAEQEYERYASSF